MRLSNARPSNHVGTSIVLNHSSVFYASCFLACDSRADRSIYLVKGIAIFAFRYSYRLVLLDRKFLHSLCSIEYTYLFNTYST